MNIDSARAALRNPPRMTWLPALAETGLVLAAGLLLFRLFAN